MQSGLRILSLLVCATTFSFASADHPPSGQRQALLVGNASYEGDDLQGITASLDTLEKVLAPRGYHVTRKENLAGEDFKKTFDAFVQSVPTNGIALFYYAGRSGYLDRLGKPYVLLRPAKTKLGNDGDYRKFGLNLPEAVQTLRTSSGARHALLFIDAAHPESNPVQNVSPGLAAFEVGTEVALVYAAAGKQTDQTPSSNAPTPFVRAIAKHLDKADLSVRTACEAIRTETAALAGGKQQPWSGGDLATSERGVGSPSKHPLAKQVRTGKLPGEAYVNSAGMVFHWCPPGSFTMGSKQTDGPATRDRKPVQVTLGKGFWMGECEVTQREYAKVLRKNPPLTFTRHKNAPFWGAQDAKIVSDFCKKLNELEGKAGSLPKGWEYACPTEAEWEYACRAGSSSTFHFGDDTRLLARYANFADKTLRDHDPGYYWASASAADGFAVALAPVGSFLPNAWGLRDVHGNVAEIVADHHLPTLPGGKDPLARKEKGGRAIMRGGAWCSLPAYCESSFRNVAPSKSKSNFTGFRIALKQK